MFSPSDILSLTLALGFPLLAIAAAKGKWLPDWCSSIVNCYGVGIIISNLRLWRVDADFMESIAAGSMLVGLPLLLFVVRLADSFRYARRMLFSFALCCIAGLAATAVAGLVFIDRIPDGYKAAGMLTGLYTGGTPNVQAIGLALEAPPDYLILIQSADVLLGGVILLGLLSFLPPLYAKIFRPTAGGEGADAGAEDTTGSSRYRMAIQLISALGVTAISVILCRAFTGNWIDPTLIILILTTLSLLITLTPLVDAIGNSYPLGEYFVLVFCVALGLMADFRELIDHGIELLAFSALAIIITTLGHLLLAWIFRIDRDTVIISYVAALYGPVFVAQVAASIGNRRLLAAGLAVSLIGFAVGNYLGIGLALLLKAFVG